MSQKTFRSILMIITYTVLLVLVLVKIDVVGGFVSRLLGTMKPIFIGFAIAFVLNRPCTAFERIYSLHFSKRWSGALAVVSAYLMVIVVVIALFSFVLPQVAESLQMFAGGLSVSVSKLQSWINELMVWINHEGLDLSGFTEQLKSILTSTLQTMSTAAEQVVSVTGGLVSFLFTFVLSIVFSIYMLSGREKLRGQCRRVLHAYVPQPWADRVHSVLHLTSDTFSSFVSGQLLEACILGGLCAGGMLFIQADYAILVGVIVGITALIPVAGAYIGGALSAFLLLIVSPVRALVFVVFLVILQQIEGNVIYPRVVGTSIGLPGLWVLAAVTVGGGLFGLLGALLSVPVASVFYTLLRRDVARRTAVSKEKEG